MNQERIAAFLKLIEDVKSDFVGRHSRSSDEQEEFEKAHRERLEAKFKVAAARAEVRRLATLEEKARQARYDAESKVRELEGHVSTEIRKLRAAENGKLEPKLTVFRAATAQVLGAKEPAEAQKAVERLLAL